MRGPGETQLETDRRLLGQRVRVLTRRLEKIQLQRQTGRQARRQIPVPTLSLVGYTNAGKSTLFRALTGADAYVADQLFATLDPTVRRVRLPGGTPAVVADTVGFVRDLPHELVAAFRSTLTEAREATLLLHVVDASDPRRDERREQVDEVLKEIGAGEIPQVLVYNKIDRLELAPRVERDADGGIRAVWISAAGGAGVDALREVITERLQRAVQQATVRLPPQAGQLRAGLYARGVVCAEHSAEDGGMVLEVRMSQADLAMLAATAEVSVTATPGASALAGASAASGAEETSAMAALASTPERAAPAKAGSPCTGAGASLQSAASRSRAAREPL
jgi:GTP-binding protein HflX